MPTLQFSELHELSITHPEKVWDEFAKEVVWTKPYTSVIDDKKSSTPKWFVGGEVNMSYNCLDKAIEEGYGDDVAVIYESPVTKTTQKITYKELLKKVELLAGVMVEKCGMRKGDVALLYFPDIPQCLIAMLACTRIGVLYSVMFGGLPPKAISFRIQQTEPKLILACNAGFEPGLVINYKEKIDNAIELGKFKPKHCIIYNRPNTEAGKLVANRDLDWAHELKTASPQGPIPVESNHPMFIIYTSGTTGEPKCLLMATGSAVVIDKYKMKYLFNLKPRECWWMLCPFASIPGQSAFSFGPLMTRSPTIIHEGDFVTNDEPGQIIKVLNRHRVVSFGVSPTVMKLLRSNSSKFDGTITYTGLRGAFVGGEISDSSLREWVSEFFKCPVYNLYGQTELNSGIVSPALGLGRPADSKAIPMLGFKPKIVDLPTGKECAREKTGKILLEAPVFPAVAFTFYKNHDKYLQTYFTKYPGFYDTTDWGRVMSDGCLEVLGRVDDIIQVGGHTILGTTVEEICLKNEDLINAAVIALDDPKSGQVPFGFLVKKNGSARTDQEVIKNTIDLVKKHIGESILFQYAIIVPDLPRTFTNISKYSLKPMVNSKECKVPSNVENPEIYKTIHDILIKNKYKAVLPTAP